ncbi:MAG: hypothetical protein KGN16_01810 [Burkholderiales bacterium]|nr:hypothetical protein [Burkholderiales bacterium]
MITAVSSSPSTTGTLQSGSDATIAGLNKQIRSLQRQLAQAQKSQGGANAAAAQAGGTPSTLVSSSQTASITSEIVSVEAQIQRLVLESQLEKIQASSNAGNGTGHTESPSHAVAAGKSAASPGQHKSASLEPQAPATPGSYAPQPQRGQIVDERA